MTVHASTGEKAYFSFVRTASNRTQNPTSNPAAVAPSPASQGAASSGAVPSRRRFSSRFGRRPAKNGNRGPNTKMLHCASSPRSLCAVGALRITGGRSAASVHERIPRAGGDFFLYCLVVIYGIMTAYNEAAGLQALLPQMPSIVNGHDLRIIVVDDGSTDATADVSRAHGCTVIRFDENRGKGAALRSGLDSIIGMPCDAVVLMDSDGQHDPARLEALTQPVLDGSADIVVGSRYITSGKRGQTPWNRYLVRTGSVSILNAILSMGITDPYSGFRALAPQALGCIHLKGDRYESELEMLFCANRGGLRLMEVAVPKIYGPGTSKMGARRGNVLGRIEVVSRYALTIARGTAGVLLGHQQAPKETVSP